MAYVLVFLFFFAQAAYAGQAIQGGGVSGGARGQRPRTPAPRQQPAAPQGPQFFVNTLPPAEIQNKQAVLETTAGPIVLDLLADAAPTHVAHFITRAREGAYDGTVFHRVIPLGIIQGGDPLSKDPSAADRYGQGGLRTLRFEANAEKATRGAVAAVLVPNDRDSAGNQFFICITDQPALDGQYTVFARVAEGLGAAGRISQVPTNDKGAPTERVVITKVTIRDRPAPMPPPFTTESAAELSKYHATIQTTLGDITVEFFPDRAPEHVRNFLRLAQTGVYETMSFHRVVKGFVIQGGFQPTRREPLDEKQESMIRTLQPEFSSTPHEKGILSMARTSGPASASTSFFIVTARASALDNQYSVFGRVIDGMDVVEKIEATPVNGEEPIARVEIRKVTVTRVP